MRTWCWVFWSRWTIREELFQVLNKYHVEITKTAGASGSPARKTFRRSFGSAAVSAEEAGASGGDAPSTDLPAAPAAGAALAEAAPPPVEAPAAPARGMGAKPKAWCFEWMLWINWNILLGRFQASGLMHKVCTQYRLEQNCSTKDSDRACMYLLYWKLLSTYFESVHTGEFILRLRAAYWAHTQYILLTYRPR